jgi:hypothetical protein
LGGNDAHPTTTRLGVLHIGVWALRRVKVGMRGLRCPQRLLSAQV